MRDLKTFISFPYQLYANHKYWVPPLRFDEMNTLRKDKNPAFEHCTAKYWLAYKEGRPVGRIAGIINRRYVELWRKKYARFGWIDFIDNEEVSMALLQTFEQWAKGEGMEAVHGPLGFTDMDREGMLVEGFDELGTLATIYNYPYYPMHLQKHGYVKDVDWVEYEMVGPREVPEKISRIAKVVAERYNLRTLKVTKAKELLPYAKEIFQVLNSSYANLYGFVPLSEKQVDTYVKQYFSFIIPDFVSVVLDGSNKVAAFGITMPSMSKAMQKARGRLFPFGFIHILNAMKQNDRVDLYLTAVRPDMQERGINAILIYEMNVLYAKRKINRVESNPELETNTKVRAQWRFYESRQHKRRRCFIKHLSPTAA
ncbi:MAG TPA: hypothetical protein VI704_01695 [Bacteroidota bacterium]|nr:hypothetical protein [Bacteroidota bacterium]